MGCEINSRSRTSQYQFWRSPVRCSLQELISPHPKDNPPFSVRGVRKEIALTGVRLIVSAKTLCWGDFTGRKVACFIFHFPQTPYRLLRLPCGLSLYPILPSSNEMYLEPFVCTVHHQCYRIECVPTVCSLHTPPSGSCL